MKVSSVDTQTEAAAPVLAPFFLPFFLPPFFNRFAWKLVNSGVLLGASALTAAAYATSLRGRSKGDYRVAVNA